MKFYSPPSDPTEVPYQYIAEHQSDYRRNYIDLDHAVTISDARGREASYRSLDEHAFALLPGPYKTDSNVNWDDDDSIKTHYYPQITQLLLEETGGKEVVLFDHTIRRSQPGAKRSAVNRVHIDQTPKSAADRVRLHSSDSAQAEERLQGRYRIINVWRPINGVVESNALAFAEAGSTQADDVVSIEHRYPHRTGETAGVKFNDGQRWNYWSGMDEGERILLQCFDSENTERRVPHSAFVDPRSGEGAKGRESIEVRALVFG